MQFKKLKSCFFNSYTSALDKNIFYLQDENESNYFLGSLNIDSINLCRFTISENDELVDAKNFQIRIEPLESNNEYQFFNLIEICQLKLLNNKYLGILSTDGFHLYKDNMIDCLFRYSIKNISVQLKIKNSIIYLKGLNSLNDNLILIGTSSGLILVLECLLDNSRKKNSPEININLKEILNKHTSSILDISVNDLNKNISISDELGNISIWKLEDSKFNLGAYFNGFNSYPCVSTSFYENLIISIYNSGHMRIFDLTNKSLLCEVLAHIKPISYLNTNKINGLIITTSEDSFVKIWKINPSSSDLISLKLSIYLENSIILGGILFGKKLDYLAVTSYESCEVNLFKIYSNTD